MNVFESIILPSGEEEPIFSGKGIPNNRLNFKFSHSRDKETKSVQLTNAVMTYKVTDLVKADPFGLGGSVNVGDDVSAGKVTLIPQLRQ
jgi:hypothetical protein